MRTRWGVAGGMGALASAEFAKTIYQYNTPAIEQNAPVVILLSDPTMPDRTQAFLNSSTEVVLNRLLDQLAQLQRLKVDKIVLCCVTLHYTWPQIPDALRKRIVSLIDVTLSEVIERRQMQLLLCSKGTRAAAIFENHERWPEAKDYVVLPEDDDQELIHTWLYQYKQPGDAKLIAPHLDALLGRYHADSFIAGCTELHLFTKHLVETNSGPAFIDPLLTIAQRFIT
jgi:aspartate racemase